MRACRTDANHAAIRDALRSVGAYVIDTSHVGQGFADLVVGWRGQWYMVELKNGALPPSKRRLTIDQQILHAQAARVGCTVHVVKTETEALALLGARRAA
jgi:hypothetical protein